MVRYFKRIGHSLFEAVLLAWSCSSGEMRNHIAVHGHTDGNTSHPVETLSLFVRIPDGAPPTLDTVHT